MSNNTCDNIRLGFETAAGHFSVFKNGEVECNGFYFGNVIEETDDEVIVEFREATNKQFMLHVGATIAFNKNGNDSHLPAHQAT